MMDGRARRVLVYTASLLIAPLPVMPWERGTREFFFALMAYGSIMTLASFYVLQGEIKLKARSLLGNKLLAASAMTLMFGAAVLIGSILHLSLG